ncbi:MAG: type II toxin-antitoxin system RelE/ParE family toxin [Methanobacteriaceae archaeon]|nr:type II toxin-antitoxin system RelE/ParE family toxin [Methanobacteriaceae archaeon]
MNLIFYKPALKQFEKLKKKNHKDYLRIKKTLCDILENPYDNKYRPIAGKTTYKRAKSGNYRICFKITHKDIIIARIGHRKNIYNIIN